MAPPRSSVPAGTGPDAVRAPGVPPISSRSTHAWCAAPGCSWRCRCCSRRSPSAGRSRCRGRRCRRRSTAKQPPGSPTTSQRAIPTACPGRQEGSAGRSGSATSCGLRLHDANRHLRSDDPRPGRGAAAQRRRRRPGRLTARDRRDGAPGQRRNRTRRERQRVGNGSAVELARAYAPLVGAGWAAGAPGTHARLRLDGRRRVRRSRRRAVRRELAVCRRRGRDRQPGRDRGPCRAAARARGGPATLPCVRARSDRGDARPRADRPGADTTRAGSSSCSTSASRSASASRAPSSPRGMPAVTITTAGERPQPLFRDTRVDAERLGRLGRAAQALVGSLDEGLELDETTTSYVYLGRRIVPGWAIQLVLIAALLPFLFGAVDLFARCRRRRIRLGRRFAATREPALFWPSLGARLRRCPRSAPVPDVGARAPLPPDGRRLPATGRRASASPSCSSSLLAGWLVGRERLLPRRPATVDGEAGRLHGGAARARPARAARRGDERLRADLPAPVAARVALASAGAQRRPPSRARPCSRPVSRARCFLVGSFARRLRPRRSTHRGISCRSSATGLRPGAGDSARVRVARDGCAARRPRVGRYAPYPTPGAAPAAGPSRARSEAALARTAARRRSTDEAVEA